MVLSTNQDGSSDARETMDPDFASTSEAGNQNGKNQDINLEHDSPNNQCNQGNDLYGNQQSNQETIITNDSNNGSRFNALNEQSAIVMCKDNMHGVVNPSNTNKDGPNPNKAHKGKDVQQLITKKVLKPDVSASSKVPGNDAGSGTAMGRPPDTPMLDLTYIESHNGASLPGSSQLKVQAPVSD
ncbi:hypothetical protein PIB30_058638 [Stylosanthes scabra]|uniref:Uncharacterized protein n=1 Tax=Stylosanthes scabra TaxID=79078 RepID=A0ABU6TKW2_9FABA|nr:hypothetical protein [Stylosanthes scabra]